MPGPWIGFALTAFAASPETPLIQASQQDARTVRVAVEVLEEQSYGGRRMDNVLSSHWLDRYIELLDPEMTVFRRTDIAEFGVWRQTLDDGVSAEPPDVDAAFVIHERYRQRMSENLAFAQSVLASPLDLTNAETFVPGRRKANLGWLASEEDAHVWWRKQTENLLIEAILEPAKDPYAAVAEHCDRVRFELSETSSVDVMNLWLRALSESFDPLIYWLPTLRPNSSDDTPPRAEEPERPRAWTVEIEGHVLGVVDLPRLYLPEEDKKWGMTVTTATRALLRNLDAKGAEGIVLVLGAYSGGTIRDAVGVAGLFLHGGAIAQFRDRSGQLQQFRDPDKKEAWSGSLVVLVGATTAAGSEIIAGALQDHGRALVVGGPRTRGVGLLPTLVQLPRDDDAPSALDPLVVVALEAFRASGFALEGRGVVPDVILPVPYDGRSRIHVSADLGEPDRVRAIVREHDPSARHLSELRSRSEQRIAANPEFDDIVRSAAALQRRAELNERSLELDLRRQDREAFTSNVGASPDEGNHVHRMTVFHEALQILLDDTVKRDTRAPGEASTGSATPPPGPAPREESLFQGGARHPDRSPAPSSLRPPPDCPSNV